MLYTGTFVFRDEQALLQTKLAAIEKKIIVGGENLLEKAEEQEKLLEQSAKELDERKAKYEKLQKEVVEKEVSQCTCTHSGASPLHARVTPTVMNSNDSNFAMLPSCVYLKRQY